MMWVKSEQHCCYVPLTCSFCSSVLSLALSVALLLLSSESMQGETMDSITVKVDKN